MIENESTKAATAKRLHAKSKNPFDVSCPRCKATFKPFWPVGFNVSERAKPAVGPMGKMLRYWREENNYGALEASAKIGCHDNVIYDIERGRTVIFSIGILKKMHRAGVRGPDGMSVIKLMRQKKIQVDNIYLFDENDKVVTLNEICRIYNIIRNTVKLRMDKLGIESGDRLDPRLVERPRKWTKAKGKAHLLPGVRPGVQRSEAVLS